MSKSKLGISNLNTVNIRGLAVIVFMLDKIKHYAGYFGTPSTDL